MLVPEDILSNYSISDDNSSATTYSVPTLSPVTGSLEVICFTIRVVWSVLAVIGNTLTLIAVRHFEFLQTPTNYLVCSLAIADIVGALFLPAEIYSVYNPDSESFIPLCIIYQAFVLISIRGNFTGLFGMGLDRYLFILFPLRYNSMIIVKLILAAIIIAWVYCVGETIILIIVTIYNGVNISGACHFAIPFPAYTTNFFMPQFYVFQLVTIVLYIFIARIARKQSKAVAHATLSNPNAEANKDGNEWKVAKMMFMVLGIYILTYTPLAISVLFLSQADSLLVIQIELISAVIFYMGGSLNPFIYAWKSKDFRKAFKTILKLKQA